MQTRTYWKNYNMTFRDETLGPSQNGSMWQTCPFVAHFDPSVASVFYDDFWGFKAVAATDYEKWAITTTDAGKTGTDGIGHTRGGQYTHYSDGDNNDESYVHTTNESWIFTAGYSLWMEVRFAMVEAATNEGNYFWGLTDKAAANMILDGNAGPAANYDGVGFFKTGGALTTVGFETSNDGTQSTTTSGWTHASGVFRDYGVHVKTESTSDTVAVCTPYVDGTAGTARNITFSGLADEMEFCMGVKNGSNAAEDYFIVDYVKIIQIRN